VTRVIAVVLTANSRTLQTALTQGSQAVKQFGGQVDALNSRSLTQFGAKATAVVAAIGLLIVTMRAVRRGIQEAVSAAVAFDASMRNVNSISRLSEGALRGLSASVIDLTRQVPKGAKNLADGLYDIASSGFQGAEGLAVLRSSAIAATAGLTDTATSAQVIAGVLNAYGLSAASASVVSDVLFQTVNVGVLRFNDLAQGMGEVVSTAAAARVPLGDVGAAIATITRAGVVPAEAFTSLNRTIQQIIQPSESLAAVFSRLGYESGASALATRGLHGVIGDLQKVTGGSAEQVLNLFTEIRAARGALALMSDQGRLYNEVAREFDDRTRLQGVTMRTFREQMRATSAQWQLFKNRVAAAAIESATHLLPAINAALRGLLELGSATGRGIDRLHPFFDALRGIGVSLGVILHDLAGAAGPLVRILASLGATAAIQTLNGLAQALDGALRFLLRFKPVLYTAAAALSLVFLPALIQTATFMFNRFVFTPIILGLANLISGAGSATVAIRGLGAAYAGLATAEAAATLGITAVFAAITAVASASSRANRQGREAADALAESFDVLAPASKRSVTALEALRAQQDAGHRTASRYQGALGSLRGELEAISPLNRNIGIEAAASSRAAAATFNELTTAARNANDAVIRLAQESGLSIAQVTQIARELDLGEALAKPWDDARGEARAAGDTIISRIRDIAKEAGVSGPALSKAIGEDIEAWQAMEKTVDDAGQSVRQSFASAVDVLAGFQPDKTSDRVVAATKKLTSAESALAALQARQGAAKKRGADDDIQLAAARRRVADAQDAVNKAQDAAGTTGTLEGFYRKQVADAEAFVSNITAATQRGLDPAFVERLLKEGPERAAPVLSRLVADHSGNLIRLVNDSERALGKISARAVELARLTQRAINAPTSRLAADLPTAQRIDLTRLDQGARATVESVARALHLPPAEVKRISDEFFIGLQHAAAARPPIKVPYVFIGPVVPARFNDRTYGGPMPVYATPVSPRNRGLAGGGPVTGPGTTTSDSIVALLSHGEYVQRAAAVTHYGQAFMRDVNALRFPRFAGGGPVLGMPRMPAGGGGATMVVVPASSTTQHQYGNVTVQAADPDEFERKLAQRRRLAALAGGPG